MVVKIILVILILVISFLPKPLFAQEQVWPDERIEAVITKVLEEKKVDVGGKTQLYQKFELVSLGEESGGKVFTADSGNIVAINNPVFKVGDKVVVTVSKGPGGESVSYISDYIRRETLYMLFALFVGITVLIGKKRGLFSILGMIFSFFIIFSFVLPQILAGKDAILISIIGSLFIIPVTFSLSHGFNKKTFSALVGTLISLLITGVLAGLFVEGSKLSGFVSEEAGFLQAAKDGLLNIKGLLLAGIIIGALGILDDMTVSQSAVVYQLKKASPNLKMKELYSKAMEVGRDHIASVVNTLVLVYTGASLPLLLLFINNPQPFAEIINYEIIAEEIVRTLVASIGLISAVPITTLTTVYLISKDKK